MLIKSSESESCPDAVTDENKIIKTERIFFSGITMLKPNVIYN